MSPRKETRLKRLTMAVAESKTLHVRDAAEVLDVSEMTVRRDVRDNPDLFEFIGGHIMLAGSGMQRAPYELSLANEVNQSAKRAACGHCVDLIQPKDVIFVDCGTTLAHLVSALPNDMEVTIICYAFNIADLVIRKPKAHLILLGGVYHPTTASFYPLQQEPLLPNLAINTALFSAAGLDLRLGATCTTMHEANLKRAAMARAQRSYLVIDGSKLGQVKAACFAQAADFEGIMTEDGPLNLPQDS